jgi:tetratricopeptide (TPR) repeat protein
VNNVEININTRTNMHNELHTWGHFAVNAHHYFIGIIIALVILFFGGWIVADQLRQNRKRLESKVDWLESVIEDNMKLLVRISSRGWDKSVEATLLNELGNYALHRNQLGKAMKSYQRSLSIRMEIVDHEGMATSMNNIGIVAHRRGDLKEAARMWRESVRIKRNNGLPIDQWLIDKGY